MSPSNVSYMGSFVLPKMEQRYQGSGDIGQPVTASQNIMNSSASALLQKTGVTTSARNIGVTSSGRPMIKVVIENQDGGNSHLPLPVQDLVKTITESRGLEESSTSVKVVCKTTGMSTTTEQTIYSRLPASSLIQTLSYASISGGLVSSQSTLPVTSSSSSSSSSSSLSSLSSRSSPARVIKYSLTPSSPNLRKILSSQVGTSSHSTVTTSSSGASQKVVMSRVNVLKKLLNKPNILNRKRQAGQAEDDAA